MSRWTTALERVVSALVPDGYRDAILGDLLEVSARRRREAGAFSAGVAVALEILRSAVSLLRWRLTGRPYMQSPAIKDPFRLSSTTPLAATVRTVRLFGSFYLRVLAVFLLVHFPLRIVGHFVRSDESIAASLGSVALQALLANMLLLVSWTLVEGALLATLVAHRHGTTLGIGAAFGESLKRFPAFVAARCLFLLGVVAGSLLLVVPGILFTCLFMLHGWLVFDRRLGAIDALSESARLVRSRLRKTLGMSLPVAGLNLAWVAVGVFVVAQTLRVTTPVMPIFKIAPLAMTLMETGFVLFTLLTGVVYVSYSAGTAPVRERAAG